MAKKPTQLEETVVAGATTPGTAIATTPGQEVLPVDLDMLMSDSGAGNENMTMKDLSVPYLTVLQPLSPQALEDGNAKFIAGAKPGMILNTATAELYAGTAAHLAAGLPPLDFVPVSYERKFIEWLDRDTSSGGFVGEHDINSDILKHCQLDEKKRWRLKTDPSHMIIETAYHYGLSYSPGSGMWDRIIISMKSTALRVNRVLNQAISRQTIRHPQIGVVQAPRWFYPWRLGSIGEVSKQGKSYFNWTVTRGEQPVSKPVYMEARRFNEEFNAGLVKRGQDQVDETDKSGSEIPF